MIGVVPAKGHSERVPGKNMRPLAGKPMLAWTIDAAIASEVFDRVIVSSDDAAILSFAAERGAQTHERVAKLATSTATTFQVCADVLRRHECDTFALLLPTSPLRTADDIRSAESVIPDADCLMSVSEYGYPPQWALEIGDGELFGRGMRAGRMDFLEDAETKRQDLTPMYKHDGAIIMCWTQAFRAARNWLGMSPIAWHTPPERSLDVDTQADFDYAEYLLGRRAICCE